MAESMATTHDSKCSWPHTTEISCAEVRKIMAAARVNMWICAAGRNGYHMFETEDPEEVCGYDGCNRTRGDLNRSWNIGRRSDGTESMG